MATHGAPQQSDEQQRMEALGRAQACEAAGDHVGALEWVKPWAEAVHGPGTAGLQQLLIVSLKRLNRHDEAEAALARYASAHPYYPMEAVVTGAIAWSEGDWLTVQLAYLDAIEAEPQLSDLVERIDVAIIQQVRNTQNASSGLLETSNLTPRLLRLNLSVEALEALRKAISCKLSLEIQDATKEDNNKDGKALGGIGDWLTVQRIASEALVSRKWQWAQSVVSDWATRNQAQSPGQVGIEAWHELLLNSCSQADSRLPDWWLVESRSLPRSGHHFLKQVLEKAWGQDFSYCESYQEPGCCKSTPCDVSAYWHYAREHGRRHLRLLKSHDFELTDATFNPPPRMIRFIQIRRPLDLLLSWLELEQLEYNRKTLEESNIPLGRIYLYHEPELLEDAWRIIEKKGNTMNRCEAESWLSAKCGYIKSFLNKWLPLARQLAPCQGMKEGGNFVLRYTDLAHWEGLLSALGHERAEEHPGMRFSPKTQILERRSTKITALIADHLELLQSADAEILTSIPSLQTLLEA